jgi:hypothetical protein
LSLSFLSLSEPLFRRNRCRRSLDAPCERQVRPQS